MTTYDKIRSALSHVPSFDRDVWVRMGMAVKAELGNDGFDLWDAWSQQAESYRPKTAREVWKSIRGGNITVASLFYEARSHGWEDDSTDFVVDRQAEMAHRERKRKEAEEEERKRKQRADMAAKLAVEMLSECVLEPHLYLDSKGFKADEYGGRGLVHPSGELLIPMRDGHIINVQRISPDGTKKFLSGGRAKGAVHVLGSASTEHWLCEGYATGLSVLLGLRALHRQANVVVCFSAGNLVHVCQHTKGRRFVVADHDESGTGELAAIKTGVKWVMPEMFGDANDLHQSMGIRAVARMMRRALET